MNRTATDYSNRYFTLIWSIHLFVFNLVRTSISLKFLNLMGLGHLAHCRVIYLAQLRSISDRSKIPTVLTTIRTEPNLTLVLEIFILNQIPQTDRTRSIENTPCIYPWRSYYQWRTAPQQIPQLPVVVAYKWCEVNYTITCCRATNSTGNILNTHSYTLIFINSVSTLINTCSTTKLLQIRNIHKIVSN